MEDQDLSDEIDFPSCDKPIKRRRNNENKSNIKKKRLIIILIPIIIVIIILVTLLCVFLIKKKNKEENITDNESISDKDTTNHQVSNSTGLTTDFIDDTYDTEEPSDSSGE